MTNKATWNKRDKVWSSATSLFEWRFRNRRRRCCLSPQKTWIEQHQKLNLKKILQVHFCEHNITFIDFIPKIGTLSLPVKNAVNANRR